MPTMLEFSTVAHVISALVTSPHVSPMGADQTLECAFELDNEGEVYTFLKTLQGLQDGDITEESLGDGAVETLMSITTQGTCEKCGDCECTIGLEPNNLMAMVRLIRGFCQRHNIKFNGREVPRWSGTEISEEMPAATAVDMTDDTPTDGGIPETPPEEFTSLFRFRSDSPLGPYNTALENEGGVVWWLYKLSRTPGWTELDWMDVAKKLKEKTALTTLSLKDLAVALEKKWSIGNSSAKVKLASTRFEWNA
ncbi:MAG: hypothetical protein ABIJ92_01165 [Candidatus Aenigmatarchaeota archaeon]